MHTYELTFAAVAKERDECRAENEKITKRFQEGRETIRRYQDDFLTLRADYGRVVVERDKLRDALDLCRLALDGIYSGDAFETLPIETMTPDQVAACDAALEAIREID